MVSRLEIAHGLVAENERLATSADALSVTRPATGSKIRTKGVLFVLASSTLPGARAREATTLVADTIRREYYYDESAGVPVCLDKAVKAADRRLRGSREVAGTQPGSIGLALAVVRNDELYLATIGAVEAYLVRSARLLMPDRTVSPGLPATDGLTIDVWRGELSVGDALLLVSRNMTETVGTEELKSAILTLHPQAAVEHLHHLFVAAGGDGPDGIIAVEAREQTTRVAGRVVAAPAGDVYGDLPGGLPEPVAGVVGASLVDLRGSLAAAGASLMDRLWDSMPRRETSATRMVPRTSRAEARRRAAIGALALIGVVFLLGVTVMLLPREGETTTIGVVAEGDSALSEARDLTLRAENISDTEPSLALELYREAWAEISGARRTGLSAAALDDLAARVRSGLDELYGARQPVTRVLHAFDETVEPVALAKGPRGEAYYLDPIASSVTRIDVDDGTRTEVVVEGDKAASGNTRIGRPVQIESSPTEVVIVDDDARAWRWRPSDNRGNGTLAKLSFLGGATWGEDHGDIATFTAGLGGYRLYVVEPSQGQILRYEPTFDGSAFQTSSGYLVTRSEIASDFRQIHIDGDVYTLTDDGVQKYVSGRYQGQFFLAEPPDAEDTRAGHDYQLLAGTSASDAADGTLYLYDAAWGRIVAFSKVDGSYQGQWVPGPGEPSMADVRGMYIVDGRRKRDPDTLVWVSPEGVFESQLVTVRPGEEPSPAPAQKGKKKKRKNA